MTEPRYRWHRDLNRYHWFVFVVAALGWLFDTMDQQLFNLARVPAMNELLAPSPGVRPAESAVGWYGPLATSVFLMGWATGGLLFGMLGDRIGRARTMLWTILVYSLCTGLSSFSQGFWDFAFYRFLTGLGVGGEFAVGVSLVAEVMPDRARPYALALLQALSTVGNIMAAFISIWLGHLEQTGVMGQWVLFGFQITSWRAMFLIGTLPALLAIVIRRRLKEPERWKEVAQHEGKRLGSYAELFGDPRWRRRAIVGLMLATSGVIGAWGIAFFSIDLTRSVLRKVFEEEARALGQAEWDRDFMRLVVRDPATMTTWASHIRPSDLINSTPESADAQQMFETVLRLSGRNLPISADSVLADTTGDDGRQEQTAQRTEYLSGEPTSTNGAELAANISERSKQIGGRLTKWAGYTLVMFNLGGFVGMYGFGPLSQRIGRRPAFALGLVAAALTTMLVFWKMDERTDIFWMIPMMGFGIFSLFGGYAVYFPELFPTRIRSTGTSFCYNVGRFVAALGPFFLGYLTSVVYHDQPEPLRYAGMTMCAVFLIGLVALPFAPETKDQPLPE